MNRRSFEPDEVVQQGESIISLHQKIDVARRLGRNSNLQIYYLTGIFGEMEGCNGVMEQLIHPKEGGTYMKIMGCHFLYKGNPEERRVFSLEQAKSMISNIPRDMIAKSFILGVAFILFFLFQRKKAIHTTNCFFEEIMHKTIRHLGQPDIRYGDMAREIRRAMQFALAKEFKMDPDQLFLAFDRPSADGRFPFQPATSQGKPESLAAVIMKITIFLCAIMDNDGAYRFPTQDAFGELNQEAAAKDGAKEFMRLVDIYCERGINLGPRITFVRSVLKVALFFMPRLRRIIQNFLVALDKEKVQLDEDDYYFCLRRTTYNFRGKPIAERLKELEEIDAEKGNQYVQIQFKH